MTVYLLQRLKEITCTYIYLSVSENIKPLDLIKQDKVSNLNSIWEETSQSL